MPAATHRARYSVLNVSLPTFEGAAGVILEDPAADRLYVRMRRDWDQVAPDEAEVLSAIEDDLRKKIATAFVGTLDMCINDISAEPLRIATKRLNK